MFSILTFPNPILFQKAMDVEHIYSVTPLLNEMKTFVENSPHVLGISLPQVGVSKRAFVARFTTGTEILINPSFDILDPTPNSLPSGEGCISLPGIIGIVQRYLMIRISYLSIFGERIFREMGGMDSIIFQHEFDHLEGILFISKTLQAF
jgi:peptide deformylase